MIDPKQTARLAEVADREPPSTALRPDTSVAEGERGLEGEEPGLVEQLWVLWESRWLVVAVLAAALFTGVAYYFLATPSYRSDVLVQVEEKKKSVAGLEELAPMLSDKAPADTEIEILRSRTLLETVVAQLGLDLVVSPRTFPVLGAALARHHEGKGPAPAWLGFGRYAWGGERIRIQRLDLPDRLLDRRLLLTATSPGRYQLATEHGSQLLEGEVGKAAQGGDADDRVEAFVAELVARPGAQFRVLKRPFDDAVDRLQDQLRINEKGKSTGIIAVALEGSNPGRVAAVLNAIADTYLRQNVERKSAEAEKTLQFIEAQLPTLKANLAAAEAELNAYQRKKGTVDLSIETQGMLDRAAEIEKALSEMDLQRTELRQRFTDGHPALLSLKEKGEQLRAERTALATRLQGLPEAELQSARLVRDVKVATELYFLLLNKAQELRVVKSGTIGNVRILDRARVARLPVSPHADRTLGLSAFLGLLGGVTLAFGYRSLRKAVSDPEEIESGTGLAVYACVPHSVRQRQLTHRARRSHWEVLAVSDPDDLAIETLRSLRTNLQFALVEAPNNIISIGGPSPGVGKSFVSVNLAHVLAAADRRVLLVDGDLRRGRLHRFLRAEREPGLSDVVGGTSTLAAALRKTASPNLDFLPTGTLPPNPSELLASHRFQAVLEEMSSAYDLVLIDTPPILAATDGALVARLAGVNLTVLRAGQHSLREITTALKRLTRSGVKVHGAVLNDLPKSTTRRYGSYGYHYQYEYKPQGDRASPE